MILSLSTTDARTAATFSDSAAAREMEQNSGYFPALEDRLDSFGGQSFHGDNADTGPLQHPLGIAAYAAYEHGIAIVQEFRHGHPPILTTTRRGRGAAID